MIIGGGATGRTPEGAKVGVMWVDDDTSVPTVALGVLDGEGERTLQVPAGANVTLAGAAYTVSGFGRDRGFPYVVLVPVAGES